MNTEIKVNLNNLTESERAQFMAIVEKANKPASKVWKPKGDEGWFYINCFKVEEAFKSYDDEFRDNLWDVGNCYQTKEQAEFALEKQKVLVELQRYAQEHNECEIDWEDESQHKYYLYYDCTGNKKVSIDYAYTAKYANQIHFTSDEIAQNAVKAIGEDRLLKYLFEVEEQQC